MKNQKTNNGQLQSGTTQAQSIAPDALPKTDRQDLELKYTKQIEINIRNIAQFRENTGKISPNLKAKYETQIAKLEQKNAELLLKIKDFSKAHKKEQVSI